MTHLQQSGFSFKSSQILLDRGCEMTVQAGKASIILSSLLSLQFVPWTSVSRVTPHDGPALPDTFY